MRKDFIIFLDEKLGVQLGDDNGLRWKASKEPSATSAWVGRRLRCRSVAPGISKQLELVLSWAKVKPLQVDLIRSNGLSDYAVSGASVGWAARSVQEGRYGASNPDYIGEATRRLLKRSSFFG